MSEIPGERPNGDSPVPDESTPEAAADGVSPEAHSAGEEAVAGSQAVPGADEPAPSPEPTSSPDLTDGSHAGLPNPIEVGFAIAGPARQNRLTVLFRAILMIPQTIVVAALAVAAGVVGIIGWFAALFTGRLPDWAAQYLTGYLRWSGRVQAYHWLLTDEYPPFALEDSDYPLRLATWPGDLNRVAVFFRFILSIPAWVLLVLVAYGAGTLSLLVTWVIVLIRGTMPERLHWALAACLRYILRYQGYTLLLTGEYPWGLFGDLDATPAVPAAFTTEGTAAPSGAATFGAGTADTGGSVAPAAQLAGSPETVIPAPGEPGALPGEPAAPGAHERPDTHWRVPGDAPWPLALPRAARPLIRVFLVTGVLLAAGLGVGIGVAVGSASPTVTKKQAFASLKSANVTLALTLNAFPGKTQACVTQPNPLKCATALDEGVSKAFATFAAKVRATPMPPGQTPAEASQLASAASQAAALFQRFSTATSIPQYQAITQSSNIQQVVTEVEQDNAIIAAALHTR